MRRIILAVTVVALILVASLDAREANAGNQKNDAHANKKELNLPPEIKDLVLREMRALYGGVATLAPALIVGDWERLATTAKKIQGSYVMKQELTVERKKELQRTMPPLFVEYDKAFHGYAGKLAHAAEEKNAEVANFYLSKMTETCIKCHTRFAKERFPELLKKGKSPAH